MSKLTPIELEDVKPEDRECAICRSEFFDTEHGKDERAPVKIDCPLCRRQFVLPTSIETLQSLAACFDLWDMAYASAGIAGSEQEGPSIESNSSALDYPPCALKQVMDVVELLVSKLDLFVNKTCGLHVHVGNETRGFTLRTLMTFASLITAFENQFDLLHHLDRHQNEFAKPLYCASRKNAPPKEKMLIIDELETVDDLIRRFYPVYDASSTEFVFEVLYWSTCNTVG
ncbi:hypothetical protein MMC07_004704 [Pseudocyphellaria aurata]|nr:hypothetical protein [Pseudocyphellaria aurata]